MPQVQINFSHLERITDDTGLMEHALGSIPRRKEGYTTDDNARALWTCSDWLHLLNSHSGSHRPQTAAQLLKLIDTYLAFLLWAQQPNGHFHNNFAYDRHMEMEQPSDDCLGRSLWASAVAYFYAPHSGQKYVAAAIFNNSMRAAEQLSRPRGWAYGLSAASLLARHARRSEHEGSILGQAAAELAPSIKKWESKLIGSYEHYSGQDWQWFEPEMTYGNGVLPWALFQSYRVTRHSAALQIARDTLNFLIEKMVSPEGIIRPIGNRGWCTRKRRSRWDQQPLDVMKLALASEAAAACLPENADDYYHIAAKCHSWFFGENDLNQLLISEEGGCCDGLTAGGVNPNQGAESTLSYLQTEAIYRRMTLKYTGCGSAQTVS